MGRPTGWMARKLGRAPMLSPERPPVWRRAHRQEFWDLIEGGLSSDEVGIASGVSQPVGSRLFREAGGMRDVSTVPLSGRLMSFVDREEIALLRAQGAGAREIAKSLGRAPSTISRELRRNASSRSGQIDYRVTNAQWHCDRRPRE